MIQVVRGLNNIPANLSASIVTIGNFDGVHLGHQAIFQRLSKIKSTLNCPIVAICFEPHPQAYFAPEKAPTRVSLFRDKLLRLEQFGVDILLCIRFNRQFSQYPAKDFVRDVLVKKLAMKHCVVGEDFCFGHKRQGNIALLQTAGAQYDFTVECSPTTEINNQRVSSTWLRQCLRENDLPMAKTLLGQHYQISGRVRKGEQRGREWGFPTINLAWPLARPSLRGIFAVQVFGLSDKPLAGAASVGCRPTVDGQDWNVEVFLLDFAGDCYGKSVSVQFLKWFREEQKFTTVDALKQQIADDVKQIRDYFNTDNVTKEGLCYE